MEFKSKSRQADDSLLRVNRQERSVQRNVGLDLSFRPAPLLHNPHVTPIQLHLQRTETQLTDFTVSSVSAQRQALAPVLEGLQLQREMLNTAGPSSHRQTLQRQIEDHQASLGAPQLQAGQYEAAVQRQADLQTPIAPLTQQPSTPAQWSQGGQWEVQRVAHPSKAGQTISLREQEQSQHLGVLRTVGTQLGQGFRTDTGPATQRYAEYSEALAPFQRLGTVTGKAVVSTALMQVPVSQRQALQRAIDDTIQRQQAQESEDRAIIQLHSLQRQLEHLNGQPEQSVMERIQARRGAGNPIPGSLRKALELELNHDLNAVRLHDDAEADTLAKKVNAVAFTTGQDIFFRAGTFNPNTRTGVELIAHEVTHTVQQAQGKAKPGIDGDAGLETEARATGARFAQVPGVTAPMTSAKRGDPSALPRTPGFKRLESGTALQRAPAGPAAQGPAGPQAGDQAYIGSFKRHLQQAALKVLNDNELRLVKQRQQYGQTGADEPAWGDLRVLAAQQARLEARWVQLTVQLQKLAGYAGVQTFDRVQTMIGATQGGHGRLSNSASVILDGLLNTPAMGTFGAMPGTSRQLDTRHQAVWYGKYAHPLALIFGQIANLDDARDLLHANYPALGILSGKVGAASLAKLPNTAANNAKLNAQVQPEFAQVIEAIKKMRGKVSAGDLPWKDMDLLVEQVKGELKISEPRRGTDPQSRAVLGWLDQQHNTDFWVNVAAAVGLIGLTVASFFVPGSTLLLVAGLAAGGTLAAKSVFDAQKQLAVSKTQALGGTAVSSVTLEQAQQRLVMAQVEALMAVAPVVATVGGMVRVGRATQVVTQAGEALTAERAGQTATQAGTTARSGQAVPRVAPAGGMNSARTAGSVNVGGVTGETAAVRGAVAASETEGLAGQLANRALSAEQQETLLAKTKNWDQVKAYIGRPATKANTPPGYTYRVRNGNAEYVRADAKSGELAPITVKNDLIVLKAGGSTRISVYSRYRSNYLEWVRATRGEAAVAAVETRLEGGNQLHHLIPDAVAQQNPLIQAALGRVRGYTIDRGTNMLDMPSLKTPSGEIIHLGSHPKFNAWVESELLKAETTLTRQGRLPLEQVSPTAIDQAVQTVETFIRAAIQQKTVPPAVLKELEGGGWKLSAAPAEERQDEVGTA